MTTQSFHAGAEAATKALLAIPATVADDGNTADQSTFEYFARRDRAIARFLTAAGDVSPQAAGVIATLAEFIVSQEQDGCYVDLSSDSAPPPLQSAMSDEERQHYRESFADGVGDLTDYRAAVLAKLSSIPFGA